MTHQDSVRGAEMRSVEETEYSGEEGTGGKKEAEVVGNKERTNVTSVAIRNQDKEQARTEPKANQHSVSSPESVSITANVKNTMNSQPATRVMKQSSFATPAHGVLFSIEITEISYNRFGSTDTMGK